MLIGAAGVLAGAGLVAGCDKDAPVQVERASYASKADCEGDWNRSDDCTLVVDGGQPASGASSSGGGVHGGGGSHWYGPYYTRSGRVYHANGDESSESVHLSHSTGVSESTSSEHALSGRGGAEGLSRGGFGESAHAGGSGEGGHGGHGG
ncbi:MAG TPA: hypothetical protein VG105_17815 [Paraburkholderia sp.]|nr:hypothetical protein [Paraburkholderia sp.]